MRLQLAFDAARAAMGMAVTRLLPMTALALAIASATGCSDRPSAQDAITSASPVATAADLEDAHARADEDVAEAGAQDGHAAHAPAVNSLPAVPATPWPSDAPLREGMRRMHRAVEALGHAEHDHLDATQTSAAAQLVQDAANFMFTNCKLPPEPDAALHGLLATLMSGAAALKLDPASTAPVAAMRDALALYPRMFEDPTWEVDTGGTR